jgi:hypothetical protein
MKHLVLFENYANNTIDTKVVKEWLEIFVEDLSDIRISDISVKIINQYNTIEKPKYIIRFLLTLSEEESKKHGKIFTENDRIDDDGVNDYTGTLTRILQNMLIEIFTKFNKKYDFKFDIVEDLLAKSYNLVTGNEVQLDSVDWMEYYDGEGSIPQTRCFVYLEHN